MRHRVYKPGILFLAATLLVTPIYGQSTNGSIGGTIEDTTKALLPGVTVTATKGSATLQLKITGIGYFQRSVVYFREIPVPTRLVTANEIEARIDESLLRAPGRYSVIVRNAGIADAQKLGDGTSNRGWLIVGYR